LLAHGFKAGNARIRWRERAFGAARVVFAGQQPEAQRRIGQQRHPQAVQGFVQRVVHRAIERAVNVLHAGHARQAVLFGQPHEFMHAIRRFIGQADVAHLASLHQRSQGVQLFMDGGLRFFPGGVVVHDAERRHVAFRPVNLVQVDHIRAQPPERCVARRNDVGPRHARPLADPGHAARRAGHLGGQHGFLPCTGRGCKPVADDGLGGAAGFGARRHRIHLGRVDEGHAALLRAVQDGVGHRFVHLFTKGHGAQADGGDVKAALAELDRVHGVEFT
jgi:hypothetical protein